MNIFEIIANLFKNPKSDWILNLEDKEISPVVIQRFLSLHPMSSKYARVLNRVVYSLPPKMYLSLAWSLLFFNGKKLDKAPFIKFPKKNDEKVKYDKLLKKIQHHLKMSDTDMRVSMKFFQDEIDKDMPGWFSYFGMGSPYWKVHNMDVSLMKNYCERKKVAAKTGMEMFF